MKRNRHLLYSTITLVGVLLLLEMTVSLLIRTGENGMPTFAEQALLPYRPSAAIVQAWIDTTRHSRYLQFDPDLGWVVRPNGASGGLYQANDEGVRVSHDRHYGGHAPAGMLRMVAVGDSFTHGDEVPARDTWAAILEGLGAHREVLNLGVPAFGTDQALLRFRRDGLRFHPQVALLGLFPDDICRNLNLMRYYLSPTAGFLMKPRYLLRHGELELINSPVLSPDQLVTLLTAPESATILQDDVWFDRREASPQWYQSIRIVQAAMSVYRGWVRHARRDRIMAGEDPEGLEVTRAIALQFVQDARRGGALPLVVLIPMREQLEGSRRYVTENAMPLVRRLREDGVQVIDMGPAMARAGVAQGIDRLFLPSSHMTPTGNRIFAEELDRQLQPVLRRLSTSTS
jgi:hypothetical protein